MSAPVTNRPIPTDGSVSHWNDSNAHHQKALGKPCPWACHPISVTGVKTRPSTSIMGAAAASWISTATTYVDYRMGYGPGILGYADPRVDEAAREPAWRVGGVFALSTELEYTGRPAHLAKWCRRPNWCASPTPAPRP